MTIENDNVREGADARRWSEFPSDADVEAAAKAMSRSFGYRESAWRRWAVAARAALEAVGVVRIEGETDGRE